MSSPSSPRCPTAEKGPGANFLAARFPGRIFGWLLLIGFSSLGQEPVGKSPLTLTVQPTGTGIQWIRTSVPLPDGWLPDRSRMRWNDGRSNFVPALRPLTWHPQRPGTARSARRVMASFPYRFSSLAPVEFHVFPQDEPSPTAPTMPIRVTVHDDRIEAAGRNGIAWRARLLAPLRQTGSEPRIEIVESHENMHWTRHHYSDPQWPRIIEVRVDALGGVVVVAHLQRRLPGDGWTPPLAWEIELPGSTARWESDRGSIAVTEVPVVHSYSQGASGALIFDQGRQRLDHPAAPLKRRGEVEIRSRPAGGLSYRYSRSRAGDKIPMQESAWQRAEFAIMPAALAPLGPTLEWPHSVSMTKSAWEAAYGGESSLELSGFPALESLLRYHHEALRRSGVRGDDWGNLTGYSDTQREGGVQGMNRLNHCPPLFQEYRRSGHRGLRELGVLWCDNFFDQSLWWGTNATGGTRYNNIRGQNRIPPEDDTTYMWRSNDSVNFCTKGYDSFFLAYEETGDPRMLEALEAQLNYAAEHLHVDRGECRNIGDVRDFVRLYQYTGRIQLLNEALRLFRELRPKLSTGNLFDQGGKPLHPDPPFIEDDAAGLRLGYAKPYIIGYALNGLPELARIVPDEPKLKEVIVAVADFLCESQDPLGGWRYPHPRSSYLILGQAMEHAWELVQADKYLGPQPRHLDAMEAVLRQRFHGWRRTGRVFSGLTGWEIATGKVKEPREINTLYLRPGDRDFRRDYDEGRPDFGGCPPEGLVYFPEVLAYYLKHRPATRLLADPAPDSPLGKVLKRVPPGP